MSDLRTVELITECRDALAEELSAWDIDPPLHHVKQAHEKCVAWLSDHALAQQAEPAADAETYLRDRYGAARGHHAWRELTEAFNAGCASAQQAEPVREWVPLTKDDFPAIRDGDTAFRSGALWADRLLKEKNHG
jgi:hypothetical protein